jgi:hypothetical protein
VDILGYNKMPRLNVEYKNIVIYKIVCNDLNIKDCYVGSTTSFTKRKCGHKTACKNENNKNYNLKVYQTIRANGGWDNFSMLEIEKYPCNDNNEATTRERYWFETLQAKMNSNIPSRTDAQYMEDNRDEKNIKALQHYHDHKEEHREEVNKKRMIYYNENKDRINASEKLKEYKKQHYIDNKEKINKAHKEYHEANKEKMNENRKKQYIENKDKEKASQKVYRDEHKEDLKLYRELNKEKICEARRIYREANRDKINENQREKRRLKALEKVVIINEL